uniref:Tetratricopeptide repeat domain 16 n=1 Tax=Xiphophorus couchianus TaxID=32473 RepID=A0A3B5LXM1_9TELE
MEKFQYEEAVLCFSKAIYLQPEQLYVSQGEAFIQLCDFQSAADSYNQANFLDPGVFNALSVSCLYRQFAILFKFKTHFIFHSRISLILVFTLQVSFEFSVLGGVSRCSLACLTAAGRHDDCLKELNHIISEGPSAELYVFRARVYKAMNQTACCLRDLRSALELDPESQQAKAMQQHLKEAGEENRHSVLKEVQLQLALTYNDFAVQCFSRGLYDEALLLLNKAIKEDKNLGGLYLNRGGELGLSNDQDLIRRCLLLSWCQIRHLF